VKIAGRDVDHFKWHPFSPPQRAKGGTTMLKVQLVVTAAGPNQGRAIPLTAARFMIGRDPDCQLRPASQAVSKKHCAVEVRDGRVFVADIGSTNGTVVRGEIITGEVEVQSGDALKVGPLEFRIEFAKLQPKKVSDQTPTPEALKAMTADSKAAMKAVMAPKLGTKPGSSSVVKPVVSNENEDAMAAMLLAMGDDGAGDGPPVVPEGSTIMDMPAVDLSNADTGPQKKPKKAVVTGAEMSNAANDILRRYIRRTGGGPPGS
jgi:predicted component of type VI protein secretion system